MPSESDIQTFISKQLGEPKPKARDKTSQGATQETSFSIPAGLEENQGQQEESQRQQEGNQENDSSQDTANSQSIVAFTYDELIVFKNLSRYLRPNPRHLKRLINVYRLVRTLAEYRKERLILDNPFSTIRWLVMCGQWPYSTSVMLHCFNELLERKEEGIISEFPQEDPLTYLFNEVEQQFSQINAKQEEGTEDRRKRRDKLDYDPDLLRMLLKLEEGRLQWEDLKVIREYTVNFNPAVESKNLRTFIPVDSIEE